MLSLSTIEPPRDKTNKMACAPSEEQPGHPPSLIRVFAVRMKKAWVLSYSLSAQRRLCSDWADAAVIWLVLSRGGSISLTAPAGDQADADMQTSHVHTCFYLNIDFAAKNS